LEVCKPVKKIEGPFASKKKSKNISTRILFYSQQIRLKRPKPQLQLSDFFFSLKFYNFKLTMKLQTSLFLFKATKINENPYLNF